MQIMKSVLPVRLDSMGMLIVMIGVLIAGGCATRRDVHTIDTRISEMELRDAEERRRREEFARNREATEQALRQQTASTRAQIDEVREEMRALSGRIEELEHILRQQQRPAGDAAERPRDEKLARLEETNAQTAQRLARLEQHLKLEPLAPPSSRIKPESAAPKMASEAELYNKARQLFEQGNMAAARKGFEQFLASYPSSDNSDNAQFWIGETFFQEKSYEKAILEYQKVIEKYPRGNKVPGALLKQGLAFLSLKDRVNSRLIFEELVRKYPNTSEAKAASDKLKELR